MIDGKRGRIRVDTPLLWTIGVYAFMGILQILSTFALSHYETEARSSDALDTLVFVNFDVVTYRFVKVK